MRKVAVVLFNLGGPDSLEAVKPFLFNLFNDPAIIGAPGPIRWLLAKAISNRRTPVARKIYDRLGGKSPLLEQTQAQARALEESLRRSGKIEAHVFIAMRYWRPMMPEAVRMVKICAPSDIVLAPLYPQFSRTTSGSSLKAWREEASRQGLATPTRALGCYSTEPGFIASMVGKIRGELETVEGPYRVLFSAHGLPKRVIESGDPYQQQVEWTARAIVEALGVEGLDSRVCYQSRVGPLKWIGPPTDSEIVRACKDGKTVVVVPVAFVSEHSETLVELDIEYRELACEHGARGYRRVMTVQDDAPFIDGLANSIHAALERPQGSISANTGGRLCDSRWTHCPCRAV